MKVKENRKSSFLTVAAIIALALLAAVTIIGSSIINNESNRRKNALESAYSRALFDMSDSVNNLEVNLSKLMVASSSSDSAEIVSETLAQAQLAQSSLSQLPFEYSSVIKTGKYFNQVGDWCASYSRAIAAKSDTEPYLEQAETLYIVARNINQNLKEIAKNTDGKCITDCIGDDRLLTMDLGSAFSDMANNSIEYPELIYDGPFSDSKKYCFRALENLDEITGDAALKKAQEIGLKNPTIVGETVGKTAAYEIDGEISGTSAHLTLSKQGGMVLGFNRTKAVGGVTLSQEEACRLGAEKVAALGYENLAAVWYNAENGVGFVNLAPQKDGVTYYTDLVKAKIALDDGELLGVEATGYCSGHCERDYSPTISEKTARSLVNARIAVEKVSLAVIPFRDSEKFCYEVYGSYKGLDYFVYIDATDGSQADVLRVIDSEQGSMIM